MIQSEKLLLPSTCTLTVSTTPSSATCQLYYNGSWHTEKSCTVPIGTTVQYQVSYSGYTTQSGSWTITSDVTKYVTLSQVQYTLTINTQNTSGTALTSTITLNGTSYSNVSTKSISVTNGTTVNYSISHSTYGTKTGSIVVTSNKTLTFKANRSSTTSEVTWTRPNMTKSNTDLDSDTFSCKCADNRYSDQHFTWHAFDSSSSTYWMPKYGDNYMTFSPGDYPIKISSLTFKVGTQGFKDLKIQYSDDNSSFTTLKSYSSAIENTTKTISVGSTAYHWWFRLRFTSQAVSQSPQVFNIGISATRESTTYSYSWIQI